jgi:hypothetical protein
MQSEHEMEISRVHAPGCVHARFNCEKCGEVEVKFNLIRVPSAEMMQAMIRLARKVHNSAHAS